MADRTRHELENELAIARIFARKLWQALHARSGLEIEHFELPYEATRMADPAYDAAEIIWKRHRIVIEPCRRILDRKTYGFSSNNAPDQAEMYIGAWPDGDRRNLTRAQVLMMAGMDADA